MAEPFVPPADPLPRLIAILLALGGLLWGVFLLLVFGWTALWPVPFGFGYIVTLGYVFRAASDGLGLGTRRLIWGLSLMVQGGWLVFALANLGSRFDGPLAFVCWWGFAFAASLVALACEWRDDESNGPDDG